MIKSTSIFIASSWKNRDRIRAMAIALRANGHQVYDFTDPKCRDVPEVPPEKQRPDLFDPEIHNYKKYLEEMVDLHAAIDGNFRALEKCAYVILMLPCGLDGHADAFYALGKGASLIVVGHPHKGEHAGTHLKANAMFDTDDQVINYFSL